MTEHVIDIGAEIEVCELAQVEALIRRCAEAALAHESVSFSAQIDVTLVGDAEIKQANLEYRGKDAVTDVLSFPMFSFYNGQALEPLEGQEEPGSGRLLLGDVLLNYGQACRQAEEYGHSAARECGFLTVHSVLHLLGYDHERNEEEQLLMRMHEEAALEAVGLIRE